MSLIPNSHLWNSIHLSGKVGRAIWSRIFRSSRHRTPGCIDRYWRSPRNRWRGWSSQVEFRGRTGPRNTRDFGQRYCEKCHRQPHNVLMVIVLNRWGLGSHRFTSQRYGSNRERGENNWAADLGQKSQFPGQCGCKHMPPAPSTNLSNTLSTDVEQERTV